MPRLNCTVQNCGNNVESCCSLSQIQVDGDHPQTAQGTCCNSFIEQTGPSNSAATPNPNLEVACDVTDCAHNNVHRCCADSISVDGAGATNSVDTECSSFCKRY